MLCSRSTNMLRSDAIYNHNRNSVKILLSASILFALLFMLFACGGTGGGNDDGGSGPGLSSWQFTNPFSGTTAGARTYHASLTHNGYVYLFGGWDSSFNEINNVDFASIGSSVGSWSGTQALPAVRMGSAAAVSNGYIYVTAGADGSLVNQTSVYLTTANANGTLNAWTTDTETLNTARRWHACVAYDGYLYVIGGNGALQNVEYGEIDVDGTIVAPWSSSGNTLEKARQLHTAVVWDGYIYVIGGSDNPKSVEFAEINPATHDVGPWIEDLATGSALPLNFQAHTSIANNGFIYIIGGDTSGANTPTTKVYYTQVLANHSLADSWTETSSMNTARFGHTSVFYNDSIYVFGGFNATPAPLSSVEFASLN